MIILPNTQRAAEVYDIARQMLQKESAGRAPGLHVSDILSPRKWFFRQSDPQDLTEDEMGFFIAGAAHHRLLQWYSGNHEISEARGEWEGIHYTIDILDKSTVIEIKTTRKPTIPAKEYAKNYDHYIAQIRCYLGCTGLTNAELWVFFLVAPHKRFTGKFATLRCYSVEIAPKEIPKIQAEMLHRKSVMLAGDLAMIPQCAEWMCRRRDKKTYKLVPFCPYWDKCKPTLPEDVPPVKKGKK